LNLKLLQNRKTKFSTPLLLRYPKTHKMIRIFSCFICLTIVTIGLGQKISYSASSKENFNISTNHVFKPYEEIISDGVNDNVYLFKIENLKNKEYVITVNNDRIDKVSLFDSSFKKYSNPLKHSRYLTHQFKGNDQPFFLKIEITKEAYIHLEIFELEEYRKQEQINFLIIGAYFGFLLLIVILNLYYFFNFKENSFLFYALFVFTLGSVFFISDGMLRFFSVNNVIALYLEGTFTFSATLFAYTFARSYLQFSEKSSKLDYFFYGSIGINSINLILYFYTKDFVHLKWLDLIGICMLIMCWAISLVRYKKNSHTKIFAWAYFFILILGIDFYAFRILGVSFLNITTKEIKIGAVVEMLTLSYAVVYRMRILKNENEKIRLDLDEYLKQISSLSNELDRDKRGEENLLKTYNLSLREKEILDLVSLGKTNKAIADELFISINTVKTHIRNIYEKLDVNSRKEIKIKLGDL